MLSNRLILRAEMICGRFGMVKVLRQGEACERGRIMNSVTRGSLPTEETIGIVPCSRRIEVKTGRPSSFRWWRASRHGNLREPDGTCAAMPDLETRSVFRRCVRLDDEGELLPILGRSKTLILEDRPPVGGVLNRQG